MEKNYDLMQENDDVEVMKYFGGERYLREKFPLMYKAVQNSILCKSDTINPKEESGIGRQDIFSTKLCDFTKSNTDAEKQTNMIMRSHFNYVNKKSAVIVENSVVDKTGKVYGYNTYVFEECYKNDVEEQLEGILTDKDYELHGESVYTGFVQNEKGEIVIDYIHTEMDDSSIYVDSSGEVVKEVKLYDPVNKYKESAMTYILYGDRNGENVSYRYKDVPNPEVINNKKYARIWCPFKISVELQKYKFFENEPLSNVDFSVKLESSNPEKYGGGGISFNNDFKNIKTRLLNDNTVLEIEIPVDWNASLTVNDINIVIGSFDFRAEFKVNYELEIGGKICNRMTTIMAATQVILTPSCVYVDPIKIQWGCLGKESILKTESGKKSVAQIKPGDRILGVDGTFVMVKSVSTGYEKDIISFQVEGSDDILQLSEAHGIQTRRGIIPAGDLLAEDEVMTEEGSYQKLVYLAIDSYNDEVYNIETEGHAMFVASGIIVTDSECSKNDNQDNETQVKLPEEFMEELRMWAKERSEKRGQKIC